MQFTYQPDGADARTWEYDPNSFPNNEMEIVERKTGFTWAQFTEALLTGSALAVHALLWVYLRRKDRTLSWDSVVFTLSETALEWTDEETLNIRRELTALMHADELDESQHTVLMAMGGPLDEDLADVLLETVPINEEDIDWENGGPEKLDEDTGPKDPGSESASES